MNMVKRIAKQRADLEQKLLDGRYAFLSKDAKRAREEADTYADLRTPFAHDVDRIIHSHSYARYMDKTQVFFQIQNDHITRRSLHVQMVSRIARTIGRCLRLNEDLIEAIAVGHDIGHTPFGHAGESSLANILEQRNIGTFVHNAQSVRMLRCIANGGKGLNLTLPVLDGILGHNGEMESSEYRFKKENLTWKTLEANVERCFTETGYDKKVMPSTLEGCVVRVSDIIAYLGKDVEDAMMLKLISKDDLPNNVVKRLGYTNRAIIASLCNDVIVESFGKGYLRFSDLVFGALTELKAFNYERIYRCPFINKQREKFEGMVRVLFDMYVSDVKHANAESSIFRDFLSHMSEEYRRNEPTERIVADYIATMTDQYFIAQYEHAFIPQPITYEQPFLRM